MISAQSGSVPRAPARVAPSDIAVIGGGTAAACLLVGLSHQLPATLEGRRTIVVFEPDDRLWRGRVYQEDGPEILANAPISEMSIHAGDPEHAGRWARAQFGEPTRDTGGWYMPRAHFGGYLVAEAEAAIGRLRERNWEVRIVNQKVRDIGIARRGAIVTTARIAVPCTTVVLCVGGQGQSDPFGLYGRPGFVGAPYPTSTGLAGIPPDRDVVVIGTGLTATDVTVALAAHGHRGRILLASRHGLLPTVRPAVPARPRTLTELTRARIRQLAHEGSYGAPALFALARAEIAAAGHDPDGLGHEIRTSEPPLTRLRRHLDGEIPAALGLLYQVAHDFGQELCYLLPESDKSALLAEYHSQISSLCCPMPRVNAERLLALGGSGQLEVLPGLRHIAPSDTGGFDAHAHGRTESAPIVVSAAGSAFHPVPPDAQPLVDSLIRLGAAVADPHGGLRIDPLSDRLIAKGDDRPQPLFALGDLTHGTLYITSGIPFIVQRAHAIAGAVCADLGRPRS
ncbi:FAD/NAD(P)-binding protein [Embleya sp. AB8]|uniref:FAD/NAD(P)-binding protein n=1 Tax=Embleya sp. AB8 TaxID=3156304 RepID=UPI003C7512DD